jgi:hypothetical protein
MCLIKGAFVGDKNFSVIKMHGTTIKISFKGYCFDSVEEIQVVLEQLTQS